MRRGFFRRRFDRLRNGKSERPVVMLGGLLLLLLWYYADHTVINIRNSYHCARKQQLVPDSDKLRSKEVECGFGWRDPLRLDPCHREVGGLSCTSTVPCYYLFVKVKLKNIFSVPIIVRVLLSGSRLNMLCAPSLYQ